MSEANQVAKAAMMQNELLNPGIIWMLYLFLGWSYGSMGKIGTQILFYLTLGGFGFWMIVRLFTLSGAIREYNNEIRAKYGFAEII